MRITTHQRRKPPTARWSSQLIRRISRWYRVVQDRANVNQGSAGSANVSASDPDGTVTSASITSAPVTGITLDSVTAASGVGELRRQRSSRKHHNGRNVQRYDSVLKQRSNSPDRNLYRGSECQRATRSSCNQSGLRWRWKHWLDFNERLH